MVPTTSPSSSATISSLLGSASMTVEGGAVLVAEGPLPGRGDDVVGEHGHDERDVFGTGDTEIH